MHMNNSAQNEALNEALKQFSHIDLADMPREVLMERLDRKYAFHFSRIPEIISLVTSDYQVIRAEGLVISPYNSLYLDTPACDFYRNHQRGFKNRVKVRYRAYPHTDTTFLEVKFKNNKNITSKERVLTDGMKWPLTTDLSQFVNGQLGSYPHADLKPTARIDYDRIGFIALDGDERFSIDFNIQFKMGKSASDFGSLAILEVKQRHYVTTPVIRAMRKMGLTEVSLSKYCLAMSALDPMLKSNNFKPAFRKIQRINHV